MAPTRAPARPGGTGSLTKNYYGLPTYAWVGLGGLSLGGLYLFVRGWRRAKAAPADTTAGMTATAGNLSPAPIIIPLPGPPGPAGGTGPPGTPGTNAPPPAPTAGGGLTGTIGNISRWDIKNWQGGDPNGDGFHYSHGGIIVETVQGYRNAIAAVAACIKAHPAGPCPGITLPTSGLKGGGVGSRYGTQPYDTTSKSSSVVSASIPGNPLVNPGGSASSIPGFGGPMGSYAPIVNSGGFKRFAAA